MVPVGQGLAPAEKRKPIARIERREINPRPTAIVRQNGKVGRKNSPKNSGHVGQGLASAVLQNTAR